MNRLQAALREKYGTPEKALAALGLDPAILALDAADGPMLRALQRNPKMAKLNATASAVRLALLTHLAPKFSLAGVAMDKMPDLTPAVDGLTRKNLRAKKGEVWARAKQIVKPVLAGDAAGPDDVALKLIEMIGGAAPEMGGEPDPTMAEANQTVDEGAMGGAPVTEPNSSAAPAGGATGAAPEEEEQPVHDEEEPDPEILQALAEKLGGDENLARACYDIMHGKGDETVQAAGTPEQSGPAIEAKDKRGAKDKRPAKDNEVDAPMSQQAKGPAMDQKAVDARVSAATRQLREDMRAEARAAQEARTFVRPWVGELSPAYDTAEAVYCATLEARGVKTKGIHPSAFRRMVEMLPKPGRQLAADEGLGRRTEKAKARGSEATRLTSRIRVMG